MQVVLEFDSCANCLLLFFNQLKSDKGLKGSRFMKVAR